VKTGRIALRPLCPVGQRKTSGKTLHHGIGHAGSTLGSEVNKELSLWQNRACRAPGTIHAATLPANPNFQTQCTYNPPE